MKKTKPLMFVGTGSDVGKSIIVTAICRILKQDGYNPAPFKAQNMALNSYVTPEGLEIGRAQAVQAEAAEIPSNTDMNPLLLKPNSDHTTQIVLNGRPIGNRDAYDFYHKEERNKLSQEVHAAFDRLHDKYDPIILEGAGSISEINLKEVDLVNMSMARYANANVILVADIDRGGVFASVYGSIMLQEPTDRARIKGIIVNKFRGDIRLFEEGCRIIENLCHIPVIGVIPYYKDILIDEEDSVDLRNKFVKAQDGKINIAVVLLKHISNFTDFNLLEQDERVHLYYTNNVEELKKAEIIIIPGTKNSINDLYELRQNGVAQAILQAYKQGSTILGICGGFQIMGQEIQDPYGVEGDYHTMPGLGLLPVTTTIEKNKVTRQVHFKFHTEDKICSGYEIHMGQTTSINNQQPINPVNFFEDGTTDGCYVNERCFGTYIHGILDNQSIINFLLAPHLKKQTEKSFDYKDFKNEQYNKLAQHVRKYLNMPLFYQILKEND